MMVNVVGNQEQHRPTEASFWVEGESSQGENDTTSYCTPREPVKGDESACTRNIGALTLCLQVMCVHDRMICGGLLNVMQKMPDMPKVMLSMTVGATSGKNFVQGRSMRSDLSVLHAINWLD